MNTTGRAAGTVVVYLAVAIIAEVIAYGAVILLNGGHSPAEPLATLVLLLSPVAGLVFARRYWLETEFIADRLVWTPVLCMFLLILVLAVSSVFMARPASSLGPVPTLTGPQTSPSSAPALPPAPTHDLGARFIHTHSGGG